MKKQKRKTQKSDKSIDNKTQIEGEVSDSVIVTGSGNVINVGRKKPPSTASKRKVQQGEKRGGNTAIIVATIGLAGVVLAALIGIIPNILKDKNNASTPTVLPTNSLVAPTPTLGFQDNCIASQVWTPYVDSDTHAKDTNGCWQLSDWGYSAQDDELQLFVDENQTYQWHGIFSILPPNADISFEIRIDQLKTTQSGDAQIVFGVVDSTSIIPDSDRYLFYHVTSSDLVASISFGEWELHNVNFLQNYVYGISQKIHFSIKGTTLEVYIDGVKVVGPTEIAFSKQAFWIGYNLPANSNLLAHISNLEIIRK